MNNNRKNVLKLFMLICLGLTITTAVFAGVEVIIKAPSHPGRPVVVDMWKNGGQLNYLAPKSDGGEPVTNYYIEYRGEWELSWKFRGSSPTLEYRVEGMDEGSRAQFRISASNTVGMSRPSIPCDLITFRDLF